ncbi:NFX1-type zinc finger-containing protein 1-like isoform X2 [Narcine bancroftii]|uniref:NFX1-type zinc finger-containing protein 1-like isoform X2 n=1 Tax=Narcine bancroftii TaxID=1343680 RepID=UPI0038312644
MESHDKQFKSMMLKQIEELQESCRTLRMTDVKVQEKQQFSKLANTCNVSSSRRATQPHGKGPRRGENSQHPLVFKTTERHSGPADKSSDHPAARHGHQAPQGVRDPRNAHPRNVQKKRGETKTRARSTGPRSWQLQGQRKPENVTVKDRIRQRDQSEPCRSTPKFYGSQPNLYAFARESNEANEGQRPRGRQPFSKGKERYNTEQCREGDRHEQETLDSQKLKQLAAKDPPDIVMNLAAPKSCLKEFLDQTSVENNLIASFLKVLVMAFSCKSNRRSLHYVLELIKNSMFLENILPRFFMNAQMEVSREVHVENSENLGNALMLLHQVLTVYPASAFLVVSILATLVQSTSNYLQSVGFPISEASEKSLQKLHQMIALLQERKQQGNLQSDTYTYFVSPNGDDFRQISIYPTHDDIYLINKPFIRPNIIKEVYPDTATYLDIQFRLYREDFVRPLRDGISKLLSCDQKDLKRQKIDDIRIYFNVCILGPLCTHSGVFYRVQFDKKFLKHVQWETSQRLLYGSFLCLSKDNFETMLFATVAYRNVQDLANGIVMLSFTESSRLAFVDVKPRDTFLMVESTAYFEAYYHVLEGIKEINDDDMPFQKYLVQCQTNVGKPKYLTNAYQNYTLEPLLNGQGNETLMKSDRSNWHHRLLQENNFNILDFATWPAKERLKLDKSQMAALQTALTKELAIIQGPPGTGKTFLGLNVVRVLLANTHIWHSFTGSSILVVCYTNHALDQFLEGIYSFLKTGLVRVGGRSSSAIIAGFSLKELRKKKDFRRNLPKYISSAYTELINERKEIQKNTELLAVALEASMKGILHLRYLSGHIELKHLRSLQMGPENNPLEQHDITEWLRLTSGSELEYNFSSSDTLDEDMWETASSVSEGDVGKLMEEREDDDEVIQVMVEADLMEAERIIDDDDLQNQLQKAQTQQVAMEEQFLAIRTEENAAPNKSQAENQDDGDWQFTSAEKRRMWNMAKKQLQLTDVMPENEAERIVDIWNLSLHNRWRLYRLWLSKYQAETKHALWKCELKYQRIVDRLKELKNQEEILLLRQSKVIGMTTTGAAKYRNLLHDIKPRIVIVEEAAEILEAHIITSLTSACQHLILIGDHQQLHPSATVYELARNFNLEVSLFERLVIMEMPFVRLDYQHRMRPEIAKLITPHIYDKLENTVSVTLYENIKEANLSKKNCPVKLLIKFPLSGDGCHGVATIGDIVKVGEGSFQPVLVHHPVHLLLENRHPIGNTERDPPELIELTVSLKCHVRVVLGTDWQLVIGSF